LIVNNGKVVRHKTIHHYEIPSVIYDYLTSNSFCAENNCAPSELEREEKYMSLMARAVGRPVESATQRSPLPDSSEPRSSQNVNTHL
jgi:hypothetical protein